MISRLRFWQWLARVAARRAGYTLVPTQQYRAALQDVAALRHYTYHSGHLTRAYRAGHQVRAFLDQVGKVLTAGVVTW